MRLIVLDKDFEILGSVPMFRTLIWARRYEKLGYFELYTSPESFPLLNAGKYLYRNDASELGVIDEVNYSQDENGNRDAYAKGNFAERLLADRIISGTVILSGNVEASMRRLVDVSAINPSDSDRVIEHLALGAVSNISGTIDSQTTGGNLSDKLYEIGNAYEISHRVLYDFQTNKLTFEVWMGVDRRDSQEENSWAIFSNSFYNVRNVVYNRSNASYKNYAYVAGEGEGSSRVIVTVDNRAPGEERKEIWVDARDLQSKDSAGNAISADTYRQQLNQRGLEKLAEYRKVETVNSSIDNQANLVYKKDFDLGDLCTYINTDVGIAADKRITEIIETYEGAATELTITFGTDDITTVQQLIKREV